MIGLMLIYLLSIKKAKKSELCNYRPISLTSILCKIMEQSCLGMSPAMTVKLLKDKIFEYVVEYGLINDSQHGFISKNRAGLTNVRTCSAEQGPPHFRGPPHMRKKIFSKSKLFISKRNSSE